MVRTSLVTLLLSNLWEYHHKFYITHSAGLALNSVTYVYSAPKTTDFGEIRQNNGHYAVQIRSSSALSVPMEAPVCNFLCVNNSNLPRTLHRFQDMANCWSNFRCGVTGAAISTHTIQHRNIWWQGTRNVSQSYDAGSISTN